MEKFTLEQFVIESNRIEGIVRKQNALNIEVAVTEMVLALPDITTADLQNFVGTIQPGAVLRSRVGMNVIVGNHTPPSGGPDIQVMLSELLKDVNYIKQHYAPSLSAYEFHIRYERLHPFTDGNGRSGRALWLWMMGGIEKVSLGFLHTFYYHTLMRSR